MCVVVPTAEIPISAVKHSFSGEQAGEGVFFMLLSAVREEFSFFSVSAVIYPPEPLKTMESRLMI